MSITIKIIYIIFVGVLLVIFAGIGIDTFYSAPEEPEMPHLLKLYNLPIEPICNPDISAQLEQEQRIFSQAEMAFKEDIGRYNGNVSIVSLIIAVLVLIISLTFFHKIFVIADGLLLGGVLTLLYSVVRVFGSGNDKVRFIVIAVVFAISLILGYIKFIKQRAN